MNNHNRLRIAYIAHKFPHLTETFTYREVEQLRKNGLDVVVFSAKLPDMGNISEEALCFIPDTIYLPNRFIIGMLSAQIQVFLRQPIKYMKLLWKSITVKVIVDKWKYRFRPIIEFTRGVYLANFLKNDSSFGHIHAQFAGGAASSAWVCSQLSGIPFSFTSHTSQYQPLIKEKIASAKFVVSISEFDKKHLLDLCGKEYSDKIIVIHLGIHLEQWYPSMSIELRENNLILSVGSLIEKKGHFYLIQACKILNQHGVDFHCIIVGGGPKYQELQNIINELDLSEKVYLAGPLAQEKLKPLYEQATIFVLPSVTSATEGTDGIPVVLMEAMACKIPCISTTVAGIPELISDGESGFLVPERNAEKLADTMEKVLNDIQLRQNLGQNARNKICEEFDIQKNVSRLAKLFVGSLQKYSENVIPEIEGFRPSERNKLSE